jgi:DNA-binding CsgD family transcriptional regulator
MPRTGELARKLRRENIVSLLAQGKNYAQVADVLEISYQTVADDVLTIRKEIKDKHDAVIRQGVLENLTLVDENAKDVIKKAYEIYNQTNDERTKVMTLKIILDAADLKKRNTMEGFNYIKIKEANELMEKSNELAKKTAAGEITDKTAQKSLMPPIIVQEKQITGAKIEVDAASTEPVVVEQPKMEDKSENLTNTQKLQENLQVNRHVKTNFFKKMEEDQIN